MRNDVAAPRVAMIAGDGIGPEVVTEARKALSACTPFRARGLADRCADPAGSAGDDGDAVVGHQAPSTVATLKLSKVPLAP
jgi:isocitrate/isopropylmalate dehydrogenase